MFTLQCFADEPWLLRRVGGLVVHCIGRVANHIPGSHNENYIYPAGYRATRIYW